MTAVGSTAASSLRILEVFADIYCPYTHVGLRRLVGIRADLGRSDVVLRVRAWPLELVNGAALTAHHAAEEIEALREVVAPDLFVGFDVTRFPTTTLPALSLAAAAYRAGNAAGEAVSLALRTALFEDGRDVSDSEELALVAVFLRHRSSRPGRSRGRAHGLAGRAVPLRNGFAALLHR